MKTTITEFVNFDLPETTTPELLISKADIFLNGFLKKQDGFLDAELVKDVKKNVWTIIIHYENFEKVNAMIGQMRISKEFEEFRSVIVPGSIRVSFFNREKIW